MLIHPLQLGDALLGHLMETFMYVVEHVIPNVHKYLSWDSDTSDLGPILPELSAPMAYPMKKLSTLESSPLAPLA